MTQEIQVFTDRNSPRGRKGIEMLFSDWSSFFLGEWILLIIVAGFASYGWHHTQGWKARWFILMPTGVLLAAVFGVYVTFIAYDNMMDHVRTYGWHLSSTAAFIMSGVAVYGTHLSIWLVGSSLGNWSMASLKERGRMPFG